MWLSGHTPISRCFFYRWSIILGCNSNFWIVARTATCYDVLHCVPLPQCHPKPCSPPPNLHSKTNWCIATVCQSLTALKCISYTFTRHHNRPGPPLVFIRAFITLSGPVCRGHVCESDTSGRKLQDELSWSLVQKFIALCFMSQYLHN